MRTPLGRALTMEEDGGHWSWWESKGTALPRPRRRGFMERTQQSSPRHTLIFLETSKTEEEGAPGCFAGAPLLLAPLLGTNPPRFVFKPGLRWEDQAGQVSGKQVGWSNCVPRAAARWKNKNHDWIWVF